MKRLIALALLLTLAAAGDAFAQTGQSPFNLSWAALDPGNDWTWRMIQDVFPMTTAPDNTGTAATVIGQIIGQLTGFVMAIAMTYVCYTTIINIHRVSETAQVLSNGMSALFLVRLAFAAVMMFPLPTGFSAGQGLVLQTAKWGIGMATAVYTNAVTAIGPDAVAIAVPQIPGTSTTVLNLMQNELCMALVNAATGATLIPPPTPTTVDLPHGGSITYAYSMAPGNGTGAPTCGIITVAEPLNGGANLAGVSVDMSTQQIAILNNIIAAIRPSIQSIATNYYSSKNQSALTPLQALYVNTTQTYTQALTSAATAIQSQLQAALQSTQLRDGNTGLIQNENQLSALGWSSAAAYYLEFSRLNGQTLSLLSGMPIVNMPSFEGLSSSLKSDIAPLFVSATSLLAKLRTYAATADNEITPNGNADASTSAYSPPDGSGTISQIFFGIGLTPTILNSIVATITPGAGSYWADPFGGLVILGNQLIMLGITALGLAGVASTTTGAAASSIFSALTGNWAGVVATVGLNVLMQFFATPVFVAISALVIPGLTIAFILPMIPWVMWMGGIAGYLILVVEAVVAVPLWMLAHMTFEGEGLHGRGLAGYELLFNVLFRPVLMLLGLFLGYFIFSAMSYLIRMSFGVAAGFVLANGNIVTNWLGLMVLLNIFVLIHVVVALQSFQLISQIPHNLPKMIGFSGAGRVDIDQFSRDAAYIGAGGALKTIERGVPSKGTTAPTQGGQSQIGNSAMPLIGYAKGASQSQGGASSADTTLQATSDVSGSSPSEEA